MTYIKKLSCGRY